MSSRETVLQGLLLFLSLGVSKAQTVSKLTSSSPSPAQAIPTYRSKSDTDGGLSSMQRWRLGTKIGSLGAGIDLAVLLTSHLGVRGQLNVTAFNYLFGIDGVDYDSRFNLRSSSVGLDWYPGRSSLRITPAVMYFNNHLDAIASVPPGNYFELGSQGFTNSVDDPLHGSAGVAFPHHTVPMLTVGFDIIGSRLSRYTMPIEVGVAYTGAPVIDVTLDGTACTSEGCFTFAENTEAQESMRQEVAKLNRTLSNFPIYPVVSVGFAYRFGRH